MNKTAIPAYAAPLRKRGSNVSRDPEAPRSRRALHGRGRQFLELRSQLCGTITTVQKDTLVWVERT